MPPLVSIELLPKLAFQIRFGKSPDQLARLANRRLEPGGITTEALGMLDVRQEVTRQANSGLRQSRVQCEGLAKMFTPMLTHAEPEVRFRLGWSALAPFSQCWPNEPVVQRPGDEQIAVRGAQRPRHYPTDKRKSLLVRRKSLARDFGTKPTRFAIVLIEINDPAGVGNIEESIR